MNLEAEVENKKLSYDQLERKYNKLKEKSGNLNKLEVREVL